VLLRLFRPSSTLSGMLRSNLRISRATSQPLSRAVAPLPRSLHHPLARDAQERHSLQTTAENVSSTTSDGVSLQEALGVWPRIAMLSFGSPAVQLAAMYRILVEEKRWMSRDKFLNALNYCLALP
jgi:hypothetical protein